MIEKETAEGEELPCGLRARGEHERKKNQSSVGLTDNDPNNHEGPEREAATGRLLTAYAAAYESAHLEKENGREYSGLVRGRNRWGRRQRGGGG